MKIVVLDGHTLNPGDISWDEFRALGELKVHERTTEDDIVPRAGDAEAVLTNKTPLHRESIRKLTNLKYIGVLATGYNVVNVDAAAKRGVVVTHVPDYATACVAQHVFALLLELTNHVSHHAYTVRKGRWTRGPDFCYWADPLIELAGLTMGIVGFGRIGQRVAALAQAFGMKVIVHSPRRKDVELDALFQRSDVVSLHCPLTPETENLVHAMRIEQMKRTSFLINTSRGGLVDDRALAAALNAGTIAGAALDVLPVEPPPKNQPLLMARNCLITPHQAWATKAARQRLMSAAAENLKSWIAGSPKNVVRPSQLAS
jgi:glycerate dehydrogenase